MHKTYLYLALTLLLALPLRAELTVVVAVNGLDPVALKQLQPFWPQGGLRTLSEEAFQTSVSFSHWLYGGDEALATMLTGTTPAHHGICSRYAFSRDTRRVEDIFLSDKRLGIGTADSYSAAPLLSTTATDRLRQTYGVNARIYAIGIEPVPAILLAGHAANACCWLGPSVRNDSLQWVSTSYYREGLPAAADRMNINGSLSHTLAHEWTPRMEIATYLHPTDEEKKHPFSYRISNTPVHQFAYANTAVVDLALDLQKDLRLGQGLTPDVLLLQLTVCTPKAQQASIASAEQEDIYLHLNQDLGYLMEQLRKRLPQSSLRLVVMGLPRLGHTSPQMADYNMPLQTLSMDKVVALTSTYLMALYGHERWIDGGYGHAIYLNRMLIEQKHLSLETIRRQVADFLMEFDGIRFACPAYEAYLNPDIAPSLHKRFAGDVIFTLQDNYTLSPSQFSVLNSQSSSPFLLWSTSPSPFPTNLHSATQVADYIFPSL